MTDNKLSSKMKVEDEFRMECSPINLENGCATPNCKSIIEKKLTFRDVMRQILVSCLIHSIVIQAGVNMSYSTVLTHGLQESTKNLKPNKDQISWIASLSTISLPLGSLICGPIMDKIGRKRVCMLSVIPVIISWILIITAESLTTVYKARLMAGFGAGLTTVGLIYIPEIAHPKIRPMLLSLNSVFVSIGILISCCLAMWLNWRQMAIVFLTINCFILLGLLIIPESPYWLLYFENGISNEQKIKNAERSLKFLNKNREIYEQECARIKDACHNKICDDNTTKSWKELTIQYFKMVASPIIYKPMLILLCFMLLQQLSGCYVVIFYAISVFHEIGGSFGAGLNEHSALVMLGVIRFIMSIITAFFSKNYGRRLLSICSGLGMAFSMFFSSMYLWLTSSYDKNVHSEETIANHKWIILVIVLLYVCTSSLGFMVIPWTMIGELLPTSFRGVGGGIMVSFAYITMFGVIKSYPNFLKIMGAQGVFFFFGIISLLATAFVYFFLPETLGKSFIEIESYFTTEKRKRFQSSDHSI